MRLRANHSEIDKWKKSHRYRSVNPSTFMKLLLALSLLAVLLLLACCYVAKDEPASSDDRLFDKP